MTPLYKSLSRYLPTAWTFITMTGIYAMVIVLIVTFLVPPSHFEMVYLDLGR